jgi:ubiquinone/menaquinone biosynthesis C-methylase UbiE
VVGIDHDEVAAGEAKQRTPALSQVQVRWGDVQALEMSDGSFDSVHTDRVLQHVPDPAAAVAEAGRVLKVGWSSGLRRTGLANPRDRPSRGSLG